MMTSELTGLILLLVLTGLVVFHRVLGRFLGLALRTVAGALFLILFGPLGSWLGLSLGVNLFNALVLGVLGAPGFGLLLMLRWAALRGL